MAENGEVFSQLDFKINQSRESALEDLESFINKSKPTNSEREKAKSSLQYLKTIVGQDKIIKEKFTEIFHQVAKISESLGILNGTAYRNSVLRELYNQYREMGNSVEDIEKVISNDFNLSIPTVHDIFITRPEQETNGNSWRFPTTIKPKKPKTAQNQKKKNNQK